MSPFGTPRASQAALKAKARRSVVHPPPRSVGSRFEAAAPQGLEFLIRLRLVNQLQPTIRLCDGTLGNRNKRSCTFEPTQARPLPVSRACDEVGTNRVSLDVSNDLQQVTILLYWKRLESSLPDSPGNSSNFVVTHDMTGKKPMHPPAHVTVCVWPKHKVYVVWHQTICEHSHRCPVTSALHQMHKRLVV